MSARLSHRYDQDFYAWTMHHVKLLRQGKFSEVDFEHIAEEMESMGKSERRELLNRLVILIAHLLKWQSQPVRRSKSWMLTIKNQRIQLQDLLADSPSLKKELENNFSHAYKRAIVVAAEQTGLDEKDFSKKPSFDLKQCLKQSFLPNE